MFFSFQSNLSSEVFYLVSWHQKVAGVYSRVSFNSDCSLHLVTESCSCREINIWLEVMCARVREENWDTERELLWRRKSTEESCCYCLVSICFCMIKLLCIFHCNAIIVSHVDDVNTQCNYDTVSQPLLATDYFHKCYVDSVWK